MATRETEIRQAGHVARRVAIGDKRSRLDKPKVHLSNNSCVGASQ